MIINKFRNLILIAVLLVTTSYAYNFTSEPAPRGSNAISYTYYSVDDKTAIIEPPTDLLNYTRNCDYPADTVFAIEFAYD